MRLNECNCGCGGTASSCMANQEGELQNYMFMENLQTIRRSVDAMIEMDPQAIDKILNDGHNWAADHIATSKDDIEEVAGFLTNKMQVPFNPKMGVPMMANKPFIHTFESYTRNYFKMEEENSDEVLAEKLMRAVRAEDWDMVKSVSMALRYRNRF